MSDQISRSALIEHIKDLPTWWADAGGFYPGSMKYPEGMYNPEDVISSIENAPTIEAALVVYGEWLSTGDLELDNIYFGNKCSACPYFKGGSRREIKCEGITDGCITCLQFTFGEERNRHRSIFCNARYQNCEIYRMLTEKYEE